MRRLLSPSWLALHVLAIVLVLAFLRLGWWQWDRATSPTGSVRSYGYALQWPAFAVFVVFMWVKMVRDDLRPAHQAGEETARAEEVAYDALSYRAGDAGTDTGRDTAGDAVDDEELAAYNRYLAGLNARAAGPPRTRARERQHQ